MNEQTKYTPGPWRFIDRSEVSGIASRDSQIPFAIEKPLSHSVIPIADICNFPPSSAEQTEIQKANARLIAAAPELLEACNKLLRQVQRAINGDKADGNFMEAELQARQIISQATNQGGAL